MMRLIFFNLIVSLLVSCNNLRDEEDTLRNLISKADLHYKAENFTKAITLLDSIISIDSTRGEFYYKRAHSKAMLYKYESSNYDYLKSIDLNYRLGDSYFGLGLNYNYVNDTLSMKYYERALQINPNDEAAQLELLLCKKRLGFADEIL